MPSPLDSSRISIHHVGGRIGSRSFPIVGEFEKDFVNVLYEADRDCIEQIRTANAHLSSELHVLPYCLGESERRAKLHINYDPFTSSLLEFNPEYAAYYQRCADHDYVFAESFKTVESRDVDMISLDQVVGSRSESVPPPNFLSIDTQGSEYEILLGARGVLKSDVVAMVVEVEFYPLYKGQKVFGDLLNLLSEQGFQFVKFLMGVYVPPHRGPIGLRGDGFHLFDDALFLRRVSDIEALDADDFTRWVMLKKLAFISIVYSQFEYALRCLDAARRFTAHSRAGDRTEPRYVSFLSELEREIANVPQEYPRTFASKYSFADSKARFGTSVRKKSIVLKVSVSAKHFAVYSNVETLLVRYGFQVLADLLKHNRLVQDSVADFLSENPGFDNEYDISGVKLNIES